METLESLERAGKQRLSPSLTNPNWLILRRRREIFRKWIKQIETRDLNVLDVGGRIQPYRPLLENRFRGYVAVDLRRTLLVNVVGDAAELPFRTQAFDLVICTQVLEYIPVQQKVIDEVRRVLQPGGRLMMSVPAIAPRDAFEDGWRFQPAGLRYLLRRFSEVEIVPEGGSIVGFFRMMNAGLDIFARYPVLRRAFRWSLCPVLNLSGELLNAMAASENDQFAANYSVLARK